MIGAGIYSEVYPFIQNNLLKLGDYGKLTISSLLGVDPWIVIATFVVTVVGVLWWMDKMNRRNLALRK